MRVLLKGGVWKNSEDEILKAGVMKYGKNEWGRLSTLLPRKTAKQCKRRWYEWLDPMIKKTEWTREEDEKLLHLAKLMPTQWRTIAPMVGRTAAQCLERYGRLLDMAAGTDSQEDEARKLRVGEIDPNPEDKPARPDPIDMDEDEKEMLSEAKARLANVHGKKAKRKAREVLLEDARRMAKLQKYRELKAAGVGGTSQALALERRRKNRKRQWHEIDYANEIPFEKPVPVGFYDTVEETEGGAALAQQESARARLFEQANKEPERRAKQERDTMKRNRERFEKLARDNLEMAIKEVEKRNNPFGAGTTLRKRTKLELPAPQVSDVELEEIARLGRRHGTLPEGATGDLVGDYSAKAPSLSAASASLRTPMAPDIVMEEARNQKVRTAAANPLEGGESVVTSGGTGFAGYAPSVASVATPSVLPENVSSRRSTVTGLTAMTRASTSTLRDHLRINADDTEGASEAIVSRREERARRKEEKTRLRGQLASLPAPKYQYEVDVSGARIASKDQDESESARVADAADEEAMEALQRKAKLEAALANRTEVAKRALPIPRRLPDSVARSPSESDSTDVSERASQLVHLAAVDLVRADVDDQEVYRDRAGLEQARKMVAEELARRPMPATDGFAALLASVHDSTMVVPAGEREVQVKHSKKATNAASVPVPFGPFRAVPRDSATADEQLASLRMEFFATHHAITEAADQLRRAEKKASKLVHGLQLRAAKASKAFMDTQRRLEQALREEATFKHMWQVELSSIPARKAEWAERAERMQVAEEKAQADFYAMAAGPAAPAQS